MGKYPVMKLPDGTEIEISPDFTPEQLTAIISAVKNPTNTSPLSESPKQEIILHRTVDEVMKMSKKFKLALFIRTYFNETQWFSAKDIKEQVFAELKTDYFGESSQISEYLSRLSEDQYFIKNKVSNRVNFRLAEKCIVEFPTVEIQDIQIMLLESA